jgi:hypothetical protein
MQLGSEPQEPPPAVGAFEELIAVSLKEGQVAYDARIAEVRREGSADGRGFRQIGVQPEHAYKSPVSVHRGVPVVASEEGGSVTPRRFEPLIALEHEVGFVGVFLVDAGE